MKKDTFLHEIKGQSVTIGDWTLWHKPTHLVNNVTDEVIEYKNVADAYENAVIDGRPLKEIVEESTIDDLFAENYIIDDSDIMIMSLEEMAEEWPEEYGPILERERKLDLN